MSRSSTLLVAAAALALAVGAGAAGPGNPLANTAQAPTLPDDAAKNTVQSMCGTACHDLSFLIGRRETADRWGEIVEDMSVRGAPGTRQDIDAVVAYLSKHFGRAAASSSPSRLAPAAAATPAQQVQPPREGATPPPRAAAAPNVDGDWPVIGQNAAGHRFSPLAQIQPANVGSLRLAWRYDMMRPGESLAIAPAQGTPARPRMSQITPLVVNGRMFVTTPFNRAVALEPETGKEIWSYQIPDTYGTQGQRSLAYRPGDGTMPATIFFGTTGGYLLALDAETGTPSESFGQRGAVNMRPGMADDFPQANYGLTSPPVFYKDIIITGSRVQEQPALGPAGDVRGWNVRTGQRLWTFHTIPRPGEPGHELWPGDTWQNRSGGNVWGLMTVDNDRGIVYLPIGCVTYDYYGGDRPGPNLYGSTLVALDAQSGKPKWHFQTTHHDVWDYDLNAPPVLVEVRREGRTIPAVAQATKQSLLFILNRETGEPIHGVEERPVPQDGFTAGEKPWPTQPFPVKPPPLARANFTASDIARITPEHTKYCQDMLQRDGGMRTGGLYLPFSERPSIMFPGTLGGINWHGPSYDPSLGYLFAATMSLGEVFQIVRDADPAKMPVARRYKFWDDEKFWPCSQPPWGELVAVNVNTGDIAWRVPLGSFPELEKLGIRNAGTPLLGGPMATAGGLVFVGGTLDDKFRAFDSRTGRELWAVDVGAAAHAVSMSYLGRDGRQYVALVVSGGGFLGDPTIPATLNVFALP
ncbi:MAG: pyrroloquinoline quinone-dependent dehydrogenase [Alphaproteobacteria bacterium]|nr:pyrroloquinoline quinone-dependent dehydrogenase [Alphaproteobacteria bacterium]